jgi:hypothetical protein
MPPKQLVVYSADLQNPDSDPRRVDLTRRYLDAENVDQYLGGFLQPSEYENAVVRYRVSDNREILVMVFSGENAEWVRKEDRIKWSGPGDFRNGWSYRSFLSMIEDAKYDLQNFLNSFCICIEKWCSRLIRYH